MLPFDKIPDEYARIAEEDAGNIAKAKLSKDKLKQMLAILTSDLLSSGVSSVAKAETMARASQRYVEFLKEAEDTMTKAELARARMKSLELAFEFYRSSNSLEKSKMRLL